MAGTWYKVVIVDYAETALEEILVLPFGTIIIELLCYRPQGDPSWKAFLLSSTSTEVQVCFLNKVIGNWQVKCSKKKLPKVSQQFQ